MPDNNTPYTRKFNTGETVEFFNFGDHRHGKQYIIVASYKTLYQNYVNQSNYCNPSRYDESNTDNVIYACYESQTGGTDWIMEVRLKLCCRNSERGKKILMEQSQNLIRNFDITQKDRFIKELLSPSATIP